MNTTIKFNNFLILSFIDSCKHKDEILYKSLNLVRIRGINILIGEVDKRIWFINIGQPMCLYAFYDSDEANRYSSLEDVIMETLRAISEDEHFNNEKVEKYFKDYCNR